MKYAIGALDYNSNVAVRNFNFFLFVPRKEMRKGIFALLMFQALI
jgi:hypothetical protein